MRLLFTARETGESGRGSLGRREKPQPAVTGEVLARLYTQGRGLYAVSFEQLLPGAEPRFRRTQLRLERQGQAVGFHVEPAAASFGPGEPCSTSTRTRTATRRDFSSETAWELVQRAAVCRCRS